ncbi:MAG: hypothetical protein FWD34_10705 [Oscillospiraceae bacterium]|nr:hypothetical protein [Oscillospiraceae bacterium]
MEAKVNSSNDKHIYIGKLKKYTDILFRVTENKTISSDMVSNCDYVKVDYSIFDNDLNKSNCLTRGINDKKMLNSLSRTRSKVFEIMICNEWEYFATFTLNPKYERDNIEVFRKQFTTWLKNYNARNNLSIRYIFIPEKHSDGINWHGHGAVVGLPVEHLTKFRRSDGITSRMKHFIKQGRELYNWNAYADKFGFVSLERIVSNEATAKYITKYITKDSDKTDIKVNKRMFYASKGLKRAEILHEGEILRDFVPDFENEYIKTKSFKTFNEALTLFTEDKGGIHNE